MQKMLDWTDDIPPEPVSVSKEDAATYVTPFSRDLLREIVHPDGARVIAVSGGVGCGKSYAIAQAVKTVCLTRPNSHVLVSAGSLTLLMSVLKKRCDEVFGHLAEFKGGVLHPHYLFANGSVAEFRPYTCHGNSAESSNSWEGRDATLLIVDERVSPDTTIETPDGPRAILDLVTEGYRGEVLGFDHEKGRPGWTRVKHSRVYADTRKSYRLKFDDGTTLDATENHPIWVDGVGYVNASEIHRLPESSSMYMWTSREEGAGRRYTGAFGAYLKADGHARLTSITAIEAFAQGCDITTESANYFANGILTHNCEQLPSTFLEHSFQRCRLNATDARGTHYDPTVVWIGRPGVIDHWTRKALEMKEQGAANVKVMRPRTFDNPVLWTYDRNGNLKNPYLDNMRASMGEAEFNCITNQIPGSEMPTRGAVYGMFEAMEYPKGNLLDWEYDGRPCYAAIDLGRAHPAVAFIAEVEVNGVWLDVIFDELQPDDTLTEGLIPQILAKGHNIKEAVCDPAGRQRNAQTGTSDIMLLRRSVDEGGLGVKVVYTLAKEKIRINAGISKMSALICNANKERHLCVTKQLWEKTKTAPPLARTIRSLLLYSWDNAGKATSAVKGGAGQPDHIADAIRYWVIRYRWHGPNGQRKRPRVAPNVGAGHSL